MKNKLIIFRIVTSNYCVSTHLRNTLNITPSNLKVFVLGDNVEKFTDEFNEITFINIPLKRKFHFFYDLFSFVLISFFIIKFRPAVVHSLMTKAGLYSSILAFIFNINVRVHTFTGQVWSNSIGLKRSLLIIVDKLICFFNTHCFTDSKSQSEFLFANGVLHKGKIIPYFLNGSISGVDLKKFDPENLISIKNEILTKFNIGKEDFLIGYIARKSVEKGCIDMLEIFSEILNRTKDINVRLLFIGPDESNGLLDKFYLANPHLKDSIIELGFVNNHHHFISVCDLMCLPSHREGFGSIVIDSAALGVPTVGYEIPGLVDSISNNFSGILVPFLNKDIFADKVVDLIYNKDILSFFSKNAKKFATDFFDADLINKEIHDFYLNNN